MLLVCSSGLECKRKTDVRHHQRNNQLGLKKCVFVSILDTMDKWDQDKLEEVIEKKQGDKGKSMPKTEIVS